MSQLFTIDGKAYRRVEDGEVLGKDRRVARLVQVDDDDVWSVMETGDGVHWHDNSGEISFGMLMFAWDSEPQEAIELAVSDKQGVRQNVLRSQVVSLWRDNEAYYRKF